MPWLIKSSKELKDDIVFDAKNGQLFYKEKFVARIREEEGTIYISLGMDTDFHFNSGEMVCGWKGEEHMDCTISMEMGSSGVIKFQENRWEHSSSGSFPEIGIGVEYIEGFAIPTRISFLGRVKKGIWRKVG